MNKNLVIGVAAVVVIAVVAVAAYAVFSGNGDDDTGSKQQQEHKYTYYEDSDIRLTVYGNANGDDIIDATDVAVLRQIIDQKNDKWEENYVYADANQDGVIDEKDIDVVNHFINGEKERMYYHNYFDRTTYVNFPIGHKIGTEGSNPIMLLMVDRAIDWWAAADQGTALDLSTDLYPQASAITKIGTEDGDFTVESVTRSGVDSLVMWTGGLAQDYFWDNAKKAGLTDDVSIVMVPVQGREVINGALMFACMLGDQSLSDDYREWYDNAMKLIDRLNSGEIPKKTVLCVAGFGSLTQDSLWAYGDHLSPGLWFNEVVNYLPQFKGSSQKNTIGYEGFVKIATDEVIMQTSCPGNVAPEEFNNFIEERYKTLFEGTPQYENQKIYSVEFDIQTSYGGPAGCYIYASHLYPEYFDFKDAMDYLQEFLDLFWPVKANAWQGFTYTGDGYGPNA